MNESREQISRLRNAGFVEADTMEKLLTALEKIITHGVWNECIHCNAKVKIAELATVQTRQCPPHDFRSLGDGTARCRDCKEQVDITETGAALSAGEGQEKTCAGCGHKWHHDTVWCPECAVKRAAEQGLDHVD